MCCRKRRAQRSSPTTIPLPVLDLEEEESVKEGIDFLFTSDFDRKIMYTLNH